METKRDATRVGNVSWGLLGEYRKTESGGRSGGYAIPTTNVEQGRTAIAKIGNEKRTMPINE